jgi:polyhydroxybutyrate depolymerase
MRSALGQWDEKMGRRGFNARLFGLATPVIALFAWADPSAGPARAESIVVDGVTRTFVVQLAARKPAPLVIVLHGNMQTSADLVSRTSWPAVARREQVSVVFPDGLNRAWEDLRPHDKRAARPPPDGTDDVAFIAKLVEKYVASGVADPKRVYVTGVSNGGAMTMTLACRRADLFAAAASVIMNLTDESAQACHPARAVPMLMMNGTADPLIPYDGGRGPAAVRPTASGRPRRRSCSVGGSTAATPAMQPASISTTATRPTKPR